MKGRRKTGRPAILVVDEDRSLSRAVALAADVRGLATVTLFDASRAIEVAVDEQPELILLELQFAGHDGSEILSELKRDQRTRSIPVFMCSGGQAPSDRLLALELGAEEYFEKPMQLVQVVERMARRIGEARTLRSARRQPEESAPANPVMAGPSDTIRVPSPLATIDATTHCESCRRSSELLPMMHSRTGQMAWVCAACRSALSPLWEKVTTMDGQDTIQQQVVGTLTSAAKILVVDDDEQLQRLLYRRALASGLWATALFDGSRVLEVAVEQQPALILLDVGLPGADGRDVLMALKSDPHTRQIPVFVHSGRSEHSDRIAALKLGADDYFEKPFDLEMLIRRILRRIEKVAESQKAPEASSSLAAQPSEVDLEQAEVLRVDRKERLSQGKIRITLERTPRRILVVEDDNDIRHSVCDILQDEGFATLSARNGREALDLLREQPSAPSLILLDLMMPVMDGWQFHDRLSQDTTIPPIPVVVMSAYARDPRMPSLPWLQKPVTLERLLSTIGEASAG